MVEPTKPWPAHDELPSLEDKAHYVRSMFDRIAGRYDLLNRLMTLGLDRTWRRRTVSSLQLAVGARVADVGCGTGDLLVELDRAGLVGVGIDLSLGMLAAGRRSGAPLVQGDAGALPFPNRCFDGVVTGFALRNFVRPRAVFDELARVLRPGGRLVILEVDRPSSALVRLGHSVWFNAVVPRLGAALSDAAAYRYLPQSVAFLPDEESLRQLLHEAGFCSIDKVQVSGGVAQIVSAQRSSTSP